MGDGGTSEGDWHVAMNFAGVYNAPCVFICENNQWAISCNSKDQTKSESYAIKAVAYGFEGIRVDGNDPLAVYEATRAAVEKARAGGGPTLIESYTYRLFAHSSSDDASKYRDDAEYQDALKKEPVGRYRKFLQDRNLWTQEWEDGIVETFREELSTAIENAENAPPPNPRTMFEGVYAETHPLLEEQWRMVEEEIDERGGSWENEGEFPL
jgi:TPP-dependent pyruvate/acetoin dehydrogenase alpha subunit